MSEPVASLEQRLLERDARAWADADDRAAYDLAISRLIDALDQAADQAGHDAALLSLADAWLGRPGSAAPDTAAQFAERLLLIPRGERASDWTRAEDLFLRAWETLGDAAERGPRSISIAPPLPRGVVLPDGADPSAAGAPAGSDDDSSAQPLSAEMERLAGGHASAASRWNDRQAALRHLERLAELARDPKRFRGPRDVAALTAAMARTRGVPPDLAAALDPVAEPGDDEPERGPD
jgi:hypothetical protein